MGRHAAGPAAPDGSAGSGETSAVTPLPARSWLREAAVLAPTGAVTTAAVLGWAVGEWWIATLGAVGAAAVVVAATWVARSVPAPE